MSLIIYISKNKNHKPILKSLTWGCRGCLAGFSPLLKETPHPQNLFGVAETFGRPLLTCYRQNALFHGLFTRRFLIRFLEGLVLQVAQLGSSSCRPRLPTAARAQFSKPKLPNPKIQNQRSQTQTLKPKIPNKRSQTKDPTSKITNQRSQTKDPKAKTQNRNFKPKFPQKPNQRFQTKDFNPKIPEHIFQTKDPKPKIPN